MTRLNALQTDESSPRTQMVGHLSVIVVPLFLIGDKVVWLELEIACTSALTESSLINFDNRIWLWKEDIEKKQGGQLDLGLSSVRL